MLFCFETEEIDSAKESKIKGSNSYFKPSRSLNKRELHVTNLQTVHRNR